MNIRLSEQQKNESYTSPERIAQLMHRVFMRENRLSRSQEHFWVMGLNNANQLLYIELIGLGRQNSVAVNPPDVFRTALHRLALKIVLVHNHPSGSLIPSQEDKSVTGHFMKAGELIGIEVLDHLIITDKGDYVSFRILGMMEELRQQLRNDRLRANQQETDRRLREHKEKELVRETQHYTRLLIAKKLKETGMDAAGISKLTSLRLPEVRGL